jgi:hypothetical protein
LLLLAKLGDVHRYDQSASCEGLCQTFDKVKIRGVCIAMRGFSVSSPVACKRSPASPHAALAHVLLTHVVTFIRSLVQDRTPPHFMHDHRM